MYIEILSKVYSVDLLESQAGSGTLTHVAVGEVVRHRSAWSHSPPVGAVVRDRVHILTSPSTVPSSGYIPVRMISAQALQRSLYVGREDCRSSRQRKEST